MNKKKNNVKEKPNFNFFINKLDNKGRSRVSIKSNDAEKIKIKEKKNTSMMKNQKSVVEKIFGVHRKKEFIRREKPLLKNKKKKRYKSRKKGDQNGVRNSLRSSFIRPIAMKPEEFFRRKILRESMHMQKDSVSDLKVQKTNR